MSTTAQAVVLVLGAASLITIASTLWIVGPGLRKTEEEIRGRIEGETVLRNTDTGAEVARVTLTRRPFGYNLTVTPGTTVWIIGRNQATVRFEQAEDDLERTP